MFDEYKLNTDEDIPGGEMTVIIFLVTRQSN